MNSLDEEFPFVKKPPKNSYNRKDESKVGSEFISEIWSNNLSNNSNTDLSFISENTAVRTESVNQVLTEDSSQHKVNAISIRLSADPDSINNDQLPEHGDFISTVKMSSESPLLSKADDTPCDSSGSYHTAVCSEILENLSDCSEPFEDIEELPTDYENQDVSESARSELLTDAQKEHSSDLLNSSGNENSLNDCSLALQLNCCEGQEQIFVNKHKRELCELNAEREIYALDGEMKVSRLDSKNEPDVNSNYKKDVSVTVNSCDEKDSFEYKAASDPLEEKNNFNSAMVPNDTLLTTNSNSYTQGIVSKSTEYDLSVRGTDIKSCKGNGDKQVQLSIIAQNSKTRVRNSTVQLAKNQKAGVSIHESPSCYLQLSSNEPEEMFQIDKFENGFKNDSCVNGKRVYADCMSETFSVASELDETDYEVQRLTALAFQSLPNPNDDYLNIYNSRAFIDFSSEECHKTNRLSNCIGLDCTGLFDSNEECSDSSNTACALYTGAEENNKELFDDLVDRVQFECVDVVVETQDKSKDLKTSRTVPKRQIELRKRQRSELKVFTSRGTINSCVSVDPGVETENKEGTSECLQNCETMPYIGNTNIKDEDSIDKQLQRATSTEGSLTKNKFASCLITNVISKKMQFEQDLKMEHGLDKNTYSSICPTPTFLKKEDIDLPPIVSQQIEHEDSTSNSEPVKFIQGNFRKKGCELNDKNIEENRNMGQTHSFSCLKCEGGLNWDEQKNKNILTCCETSAFRNWSESNTGSQNETCADRTLELSAEKSCPMLHDLSTNISEQGEKMNAPCISGNKYIDYMSQASEEKFESNERMQSKQTPYKDRTRDIQSGNTQCNINASSNILALKSPEILHSSQTANMQQTSPFCIAKEFSPTMDSNTIALDLKYQILPTSFKLESGLEQDEVSLSNIKENASTKNKTKDPTYYVRDVRKLVRNTYSALTFCATKVKSDVPEEVHNPSSREQSLPATHHKLSMNDSLLSPILIQCQSINRKADEDDHSHATVDKKYWTCTGSSGTSSIFSSDFKLPIPFNKQENKVISAKRIGSQSYSIKENGINAAEQLTCFNNKITPERKIQALLISNNEESKLSFMKVQVGAEDQKNHSANFVLNNEIADLVPGKSKQKNELQVGLENINTHLSSSTSTAEDIEMSLSEMEPNRDSQREVESENEFLTKSNSKKEDISMVLYKDESRREAPDKMQNQTTLLNNSPFDSSQRKHESKKSVQTELDFQNNQLRIFGYNDEYVELSNEKSYPQNDIQVNLKNQNSLFHNSTISNKDFDASSRKDDTNKDINMKLENQNKCLRISTSTDKETQTPLRKGKHKKEIQFKLEKQNKMLGNLTLDNEDVVMPHGKHELKRELQVSLDNQNKLFENSTLHVGGANLLLDDPKGQIELEQDNQSALFLKIEDGNTLSGINKHNNEIQRGLQNETKSLYSSGSNCKEIKLSSRKSNLKEEIHDIVESQNKLLNHCMQNNGDIKLPAVTRKNKKEFKIEHITQKRTGKVEMIPTTEKAGLTFITELQPFKDNSTIPMVSEEEGQSATKGCSESNNDEQLSSVQIQLPNETSLIPVKTTEKSVISVEPSNCPETIKISASTSIQETETQDVHDQSIFSPDLQNAAVNKLLTSQATSSFTNLNVKLLDSINPVVKLPNNTVCGQAKQQSLGMKIVAMNKAFTQEEASVSSDRVNYLTIPIKEQNLQASPQIQMLASPHPVIFKPGHYSTTTSPRQQNWDTLDPHKQEQQTLSHHLLEEFQSFGTSLQHPFYTSQVPNKAEPHLAHFPSTGQTPNAVEKCYKVPQSPHFIANPQFPCFPYSQVNKKMLIDPETGKHYFIEAPVQSPRKMLLDPETGCYVEIIIPQQTYSGAPFSSYVLYPYTMRSSYIPKMQYPNLLSTPLVMYSGLSPEPSEGQMQTHLNSTTDKQDHKNNKQKNQLAESNYMESAYYMGMSVNPNPAQTSMEVISTHSKSGVEVKNNSNAILSSQQI